MSKSFRLAALVAVAAAGIIVSANEAQAQGPYQFNSLTPCRVFDTRDNVAGSVTNVTNGQQLANPGPHYFTVRGKCAVPATAMAVTVNITVVGPNSGGDLRIYPSDAGAPTVSTLNYNANEPALANGAIVPLAGTAGGANKDVAIALGMLATAPTGRIHVLMDVTGYFQ